MSRGILHVLGIAFVLQLAAGVGAGCQRRPGSARAGPARALDDPAPEDRPWFREQAASSGLRFDHRSGHRDETFLFPEIVGGGVALLDMDGDGDLDVYFVQSGSLRERGGEGGTNRLFRNDGRGHFEDVTEGSGAGDRGYGMGAATGDCDGDGRPDLYVTNVGPNVLLRNRGDGTFVDVTAEAGVGEEGWGTSAAFFDADADGDLDLFVANYIYWSMAAEQRCRSPFGRPDYCSPNRYAAPMPDAFYRNDGGGTFTEVSSAAGLRAAFGNGLGVVCGDFDGDGREDVFVANDATMNQLWRNQGDGTFRDVGPRTGCAVDQHGRPKAGMGAAAADVDDDGDLDLLVVNLRAESDSFFRNEQDYFIDDTAAVGLGSASRPYTRFGMGLVDFDNDGWLDLFEVSGRVRAFAEVAPRSDDPYAEPNVLLRGDGRGRFEPVRPAGGTAAPLVATSRAAAFGDLDGDGGVDVVVVNRDGPAYLLRNVVPQRGHWIEFRVLNERGADAIGAQVSMRAGARAIRRDVRTAYSYCAANDPRVHVGLGGLEGVSGVTVRWIDGAVEAFGAFDAGEVITLRRGGGAAAAGARGR